MVESLLSLASASYNATCECVCIFPCARERTRTELGCRLVRLLRQMWIDKTTTSAKMLYKIVCMSLWKRERISTAFSCVLCFPIKSFLLLLLNREKARLDDVDERIFLRRKFSSSRSEGAAWEIEYFSSFFLSEKCLKTFLLFARMSRRKAISFCSFVRRRHVFCAHRSHTEYFFHRTYFYWFF